MKKIFILTGLLVTTSSCTYDDVVAFLNGQTNNLTEAEKQSVREYQDSGMALEELEKDKGTLTPPKH
ncbi:hypothetical protein BWK59_14780 [Flavobacterium davisii]|uniref:Lipoprotein n=1 Tax=Flavobacterium davisii TaxID=2906077 RepID=A0A246GEW3_9FLAO|nr:hypothetical protein [Flavobacterium davisii]OWP82645.1 hypothetical protein BWK59_14780 [Flavobacterium davisii]